MDTSTLVLRLLDVIEFDIAAETRRGVSDGNKLFGAAILRKSDLSVVIAETNNETENPLWHWYQPGWAVLPEDIPGDSVSRGIDADWYRTDDCP